MQMDPDQRTYDILRLLAVHEPIGSVHLTEQLRERGYSLTERTTRLTLADLDEAGLTEKVGGKGRRLTPAGCAELERGGVRGRVDQVRERLAELTSRVTYDPTDDVGNVIVGTAIAPASARARVVRELRTLDASPLGPVPVSIEPAERAETDCIEISAASSVTIDGVLLDHGIESDLETAGVIEYHPDPESVPYDDPDAAAHGGAVLRFVDVIGDERATLDMVSLLIEARRTSVGRALNGGTGLVVADNREVPLSTYDAALDLATATRDQLGGVIDLRRPRESGPFPWNGPSWSFASLTCAGAAELVISRLVETDLATDWTTLAGTRSRATLSPVDSY
jgi:HTH-type transcriptional regulator, global nitrogen regulator NrpRI